MFFKRQKGSGFTYYFIVMKLFVLKDYFKSDVSFFESK